MAIIVVVIAGPAANFRRVPVHQRDDGMVGYPTTLHAMIVDDIAESLFTDWKGRQAPSISRTCVESTATLSRLP